MKKINNKGRITNKISAFEIGAGWGFSLPASAKSAAIGGHGIISLTLA